MDISILSQHIANAADRLNETRVSPGFRLFAEVADVHLEYVVVSAKVIAPDVGEDLLALQYLSRVTQEKV
jgi:hypothetical protein